MFTRPRATDNGQLTTDNMDNSHTAAVPGSHPSSNNEEFRHGPPDFSDDGARRDWLIEMLGEATCRKLGLFPIPGSLTLSVVIPVYDERATIHEILRRVRAVPIKKQIIVVDDCSRDGTREILRDLEKSGDADLKVIFQDRNQGKGAALRTGFRYATGDIVIVQDADLEYEPEQYPELIQPIVDDQADVVFGSRFIGDSHRVLYFWHSLANKWLTLLSNMFTNLNLTDMEVCYKVFRREVIQGIALKSDRFGFEPEITAKVARFKIPGRSGERPRPCRIYESPRGLIMAEPIEREKRSGSRTASRHFIASFASHLLIESASVNKISLASLIVAAVFVASGPSLFAQAAAPVQQGNAQESQPSADEKTAQDLDKSNPNPKAKSKGTGAKKTAARRDPPGLYMGRQIADVMSWEGVDWLFRETRVDEEQPEAMLAALKIPKGATVADVGAGAGYHSILLAAASAVIGELVQSVRPG